MGRESIAVSLMADSRTTTESIRCGRAFSAVSSCMTENDFVSVASDTTEQVSDVASALASINKESLRARYQAIESD
jgi:hypothetical protein